MLRAHIYAARAAAERAIDAIDAAHHPDGTEQVTVLPGARSLRDPAVRARCVEITLPDGTQRLGYRERRPAKTWAEPIELEDGRHAVPYREDRLAVLADREVTVGGQRLRVPRPDEAIDLEVATDENGDPITREDGSVVLRERVRTEEPVDGPTRTR